MNKSPAFKALRPGASPDLATTEGALPDRMPVIEGIKGCFRANAQSSSEAIRYCLSYTGSAAQKTHEDMHANS